MQDKIDKLPRWAQDHISKLQAERDTALRSLNHFIDSTTPSAFYYDEVACLGEGERGRPTVKRHYIQTEKITVVAHGIEFEVRLPYREKHIQLSWVDSERLGNQVAMVPKTLQQCDLISRGNMRHI